MEKTAKLINLLLIFMPLVFLTLMAGIIGLVLFEIRRCKFLFI